VCCDHFSVPAREAPKKRFILSQQTSIQNRKEKKIMLPIKKIVAPTDFSDPSYRGLAAAEELARHFSGELIIVHVVSHVHFVPPTGPPISGGHEIPTLMEELEAGAIKGLKEIQEKRISEKLRSRRSSYGVRRRMRSSARPKRKRRMPLSYPPTV
jgi:hypothetical protein